ncbi:MAG: SMC family ATPase [Desulfurococcaceae archaeon]
MRILGIYLENIRSYRNSVIVFPNKGVIAIHGASGSGKTSILMAISFALLGLVPRSWHGNEVFEAFAYPTGEDLLRAGSNYGKVRLLIQADRLYLIERTIVRVGDRIESRGGRIEIYEIEGEEIKLKRYEPYSSKEEMDRRIREILKIREVEKGKPLLFTNVLYAPQFNVHEILMLDSEKRREIIERALGLERYREFRRNYEKLISKALNKEISSIDNKIEIYRQQLIQLDKEKINREKNELEKKLSSIKNEMIALENRLSELENRKGGLESDRDKYRDMESELKALIQKRVEINEEIERIKKELSKLGDLVELSPHDLSNLRERISKEEQEIESKITKLREELVMIDKEMNELESTLSEKEREEKRFRDMLMSKQRDISYWSARLDEKKRDLKEVNELIAIGKCPVCRQPITHEHGYALINEITREMEDIETRLKQFDNEYESLSKALKDVQHEIESLRGRINDLRKRRNVVEDEIWELSKRSNLLKERKGQLDKAEVMLDKLRKALEELESLKSVENRLNDIERSKVEIEGELEKVNQEINVIRKEIERLSREYYSISADIKVLENKLLSIVELEKSLENLEKQAKKLHRLRDILAKINNVVDIVEKEISKIMLETFRGFFYNFLALLIPDQPIEVVIGDDLSVMPRIRIGERTYDLRSPSGGQDIAISLAYRLALNATVRQYSPMLKKAVLILDEPTTGFSRELVDRLKSVLREIGRLEGQVIIVTHDDSLIEAGDCKIRLRLDQRNHETIISYEECLIENVDFDEYRRVIENVLRGVIRSKNVQEQVTDISTRGFRSEIRIISESAKKNILDFSKKDKSQV